MKNILSVLLISGATVTLMSCGGSGGGGGGGSVLGGGGTDGYLADTSAYIDSDGDLILTMVNGDDVIVGDDESATLNGTVMSEGTYNTVYTNAFVGTENYFAAVYNVDGAPKAFYSFIDVNDLYEAGSKQPLQSKVEDYDWEYTGVQSVYVKADGANVSSQYFDLDGTINYDGNGNWTAEMGPVSLDGTLDGYRVSGDMTFDDGVSQMDGTFDGVDGFDPDYDEDLTAGGFAGANATGSETVAGVWIWGEY